jgi:hypothetical protein
MGTLNNRKKIVYDFQRFLMTLSIDFGVSFVSTIGTKQEFGWGLHKRKGGLPPKLYEK